MPDREKVINAYECVITRGKSVCECGECDYYIKDSTVFFCDNQRVLTDVLALLKEYKQSEQSYLRTLVELSNERDKLLKELGREDEHKYKDGSFMAGSNGIVKL